MDDAIVLSLVRADLCKNEGIGAPNSYVRKQMARLDQAIRVTRKVQASRFKASLVAFRNERLAHSLTSSQMMGKPSPKLKYGYERRLLRASIAVIGGLNGALRDSNFMFKDAFEQSRRNAKALWLGCKFTVLE
jgi:hypothetical protein